MRYGFFDDENKEYVITNPQTPEPWSNYLGSVEYGAIVTNNAGGYSFYRSGGKGRFIRMHFNTILKDQPGKFLYFRDRDAGDIWSASWQPVGVPLEDYTTECRHGTAYTSIKSNYKHIESKVTFFVPLNQHYEVWRVSLTNRDSVRRKLSAFTYVEYSGSWSALDDLLNIQYTQYTTIMAVKDGIIDHGTNVNIPPMPDNFDEKDQGRHTFMALAGAPVTNWDTDRERFVGKYRTYKNPIAVESGTCSGSLAYGDNACGSLQTDIDLEPGESKDFLVLVGVGRADAEGQQIRGKYQDIKKADQELNELKQAWHHHLARFTVQTPDQQLNSTVNVWGMYNNLITYSWSRAVSLVYTGVDRDGLGYRDTVQDFIGVVHSIPEQVGERLKLMITGQLSNGAALPVVYPTRHKPGQEAAPHDDEYRSDDSMWLFYAIPDYVKETGDMDFYNKVLPYADRGEDTVFRHMKRAIEFTLEHSGEHGLPLGLKADWNDCVRFGKTGESAFVAMQLRLALSVYVDVAERLGEASEVEWGQTRLEKLDDAIQKHVWDGEWFLRGYGENHARYGGHENKEGSLFLNPQVWAVMGGAASPEQAESAMNAVHERLATRYGLMICDPPFTREDHTIMRAQLMNPGNKENGGIFIHTQGWAVIAETLLGHGDRAYEYLRDYLPAAYNDHADVREVEPYVVCQSTHSRHSPKEGTSRLPWLSGSAAWTYYALTRYILGVRPDYDALVIDPCIPCKWDAFTVTREFRGCSFHISVDNSARVQRGVKSLIVNGKALDGTRIPAAEFESENKVEVILG